MNLTFDSPRGDHVALTGDGVLDARRTVLEEHHHQLQHHDSDRWIDVPARAVIVDIAGPTVEVGPFDLSPDDARLLGESLRLLAELADLREQTR